MDRKHLLEKLEQMKKEFARKEKKLEKAKRATRVKAHVKKKIQELNSQADGERHQGKPIEDAPSNKISSVTFFSDAGDFTASMGDGNGCHPESTLLDTESGLEKPDSKGPFKSSLQEKSGNNNTEQMCKVGNAQEKGAEIYQADDGHHGFDLKGGVKADNVAESQIQSLAAKVQKEQDLVNDNDPVNVSKNSSAVSGKPLENPYVLTDLDSDSLTSLTSFKGTCSDITPSELQMDAAAYADTETFTLNLHSQSDTVEGQKEENSVIVIDPDTDSFTLNLNSCEPSQPAEAENVIPTKSIVNSVPDFDTDTFTLNLQSEVTQVEAVRFHSPPTGQSDCVHDVSEPNATGKNKNKDSVTSNASESAAENSETNHCSDAEGSCDSNHKVSASPNTTSSSVGSQQWSKFEDSEVFSEYTELDNIPFSQFELTEDFLSEALQPFDQSCRQGRHRRRQSTALVQRRSPRLSALDFSSCDRLRKISPSSAVSWAGQSSLLRLVRKRRKSKNALFLSSLFQYLIDEAKRDKSVVEFQLPSDISGLVELHRNVAASTTARHSLHTGDQIMSENDKALYAEQEDLNQDSRQDPENTGSVPVTEAKDPSCQRSHPDRENDGISLTDSEIQVIPETEVIPDLESQSCWYSVMDDTVVEKEAQEMGSNSRSEDITDQQVVDSNMDDRIFRVLSSDDVENETSTSQKSEDYSSRDTRKSPIAYRTVHIPSCLQDIQGKKSHMNTVYADKPPHRRVSLYRKNRFSRSVTKSAKLAAEGSEELSGEKEHVSTPEERSSPQNSQVLSIPECRKRLVSPPNTPIQRVNIDSDMVDSPSLFGTQTHIPDQSTEVKQNDEKITSDTRDLPDSMAHRCVVDKTVESNSGREETTKPVAVFTPSKDKSSQRNKSVASILAYSGCAESGCKELVLDIVTGTSSDGTHTAYILSVQSTALTLWTQEDGSAWTAELHWYLPQESRAEKACSIPSKDGSLTVLVRGLSVDLATPFLTVFIFHWTTQHTLRFPLPLPSPVIPYRLLCHGLPALPSTALVFATDKAYTRGKMYQLDTSQGCISTETEMEMVNACLVDVQLVDELPHAALGLTDDQKFVLWNVIKGVFLLTLSLPASFPPVCRLFSSYFCKGYLLQHVIPADGSCGPCLIAINPTSSKGTILHKFQADRKEQRNCKQVWVCHDILMGLTQNGLCIWDACSARSLVTMDTSPKNIECAALLGSDKTRWLVTGHGGGCMHIYSVNL